MNWKNNLKTFPVRITPLLSPYQVVLTKAIDGSNPPPVFLTMTHVWMPALCTSSIRASYLSCNHPALKATWIHTARTTTVTQVGQFNLEKVKFLIHRASIKTCRLYRRCGIVRVLWEVWIILVRELPCTGILGWYRLWWYNSPIEFTRTRRLRIELHRYKLRVVGTEEVMVWLCLISILSRRLMCSAQMVTTRSPAWGLQGITTKGNTIIGIKGI